jgi:hypothetical protein
MAEAASRLYVPAFGGLYSAVNEYAEPILRIGVGAILIPHGMQKLFGAFGGMGLTNNAALFDRLGYTPGIVLLLGDAGRMHRTRRWHPAGARTIHPLCRRCGADLHDRGGEIHSRQGFLPERRRL